MVDRNTSSSWTPLPCSSLSAPSYCLISLLLSSLLLSGLFVTPVEANCAAVRPQHDAPNLCLLYGSARYQQQGKREIDN